MKTHVVADSEIIFRAYDLNEYSIDDSNRREESFIMARQPDAQFGYFNTNQFALTGSNDFTGTQTITGSLQISGSLYYNGHKQYNYGQFYDMTSQSGSSGSIQSMKLNTTDLSEGVSIVSGSHIKVENAGVYNLQFSAQLENTVNTNIVFNIWFAKNGTPIPNSNTHIDVARAQSAQLGKVPAAWNFLSHLNTDDYLEIKWTCNDTGGILHMDAGTPSIPATPSVIVTITQIA